MEMIYLSSPATPSTPGHPAPGYQHYTPGQETPGKDCNKSACRLVFLLISFPPSSVSIYYEVFSPYIALLFQIMP